MVKTGTWATAVWVGKGANEDATGDMGVLSCANNEVLVGDGMDAIADTEPGTLVWAKDVGVVIKAGGAFVRGCKRYDPVIAIAVLVLLAFCTAASLAGPPEAIQSRIIKPTNRPVTPSACK